jgi:predicted ribosome quality control (RQC) complex YloA/Tae2 family protein
MERTANAEDLRARGELLLTYATAVPRGASHFRADGVELELDPRATAVETAQALFRRYRKAKAALREVPTLLAETALRLRYLDEVAALAELAETPEELRAIRSEIRPRTERPEVQKKGRRARPVRRPEANVLRLRTSTGQELLVGRSARQNQFVTFELARPEDIWLHAHGVPGSHVILRAPDGPPPRAALEEAAVVAARYSASRAAGRVSVDWTPKKYVRPLAKGTPGLVTYSNEQTIVARL